MNFGRERCFLSLQMLKDADGQLLFSHADFLAHMGETIEKAPLYDGSHSDFFNTLHNPKAVERSEEPAHFTTSCIILHPKERSILLVHHKKYGEWVYPGGHPDGDWFFLRSALRECFEETGLEEVEAFRPKYTDDQNSSKNIAGIPLCFCLPHFVQGFDLPAFGNEPAHKHFDLVYLFRATTERVKFNDQESSGIRWVGFERLKKQASFRIERDEDITLLTANICVHALESLN